MSQQSNQSTHPGPRELPVDLPGLRPGNIPLPADFGLDTFIDAIAATESDASRTNPHTAAKVVRSALRSWILGFETHAVTIRQRQDVVRTFWDRPALGELVQDLDVTSYDPNQEARGGYQYHLERFETYAKALTSLRAALGGAAARLAHRRPRRPGRRRVRGIRCGPQAQPPPGS